MAKTELLEKYWKPGNIIVWYQPGINFDTITAQVVVNEALAVGLNGYETREIMEHENISILGFWKIGDTPERGLEPLLNRLHQYHKTYLEDKSHCCDNTGIQASCLWIGEADGSWDKMMEELKEKFSWGKNFEKDTNCKGNKGLIREFYEGRYGDMLISGINWSATEREDYWCDIYSTLKVLGH